MDPIICVALLTLPTKPPFFWRRIPMSSAACFRWAFLQALYSEDVYDSEEGPSNTCICLEASEDDSPIWRGLQGAMEESHVTG